MRWNRVVPFDKQRRTAPASRRRNSHRKRAGLSSRPLQALSSPFGLAAEIDHGAAVLGFANARSRRHERIVEALALDGDTGAVHAFADHLVLDGFGAADRQ